MILVNNQPLDLTKKDDERVKWYTKEIEKIQKKDSVVIKRIVQFRLDSQGKRHMPPVQGIQSRCLLQTNRGDEMWACCQTYKKNQDDSLSLTPNFYFLSTMITLNPKTQSELIFYLTSVVNLAKYGYALDNPELEAKEINEKDLAELDVKYAINRRIESVEELRHIAKSWGMSAADALGVEQLKLRLFEAVKASEANKEATKKGYKEFMDEVFNTDPEVTEARALVTMAVDKGVVRIDRQTRRCIYTPTGDSICIVPLDHAARVNDFLADTLLKGKNKDLLDTLRIDVLGPVTEEKVSVADIEALKTRAELKKMANRLSIVVPPNMKDEAIREKLIKAIQE